jgi:transposase
MNLKDTRKLSPETQQELRMRAINMLECGHAVTYTAKTLGVSRYSVHKWKNAYKKGGEKALKSTKRGRRKGCGKKLKNYQCATIVNIIKDRGPSQEKMPFVLWTRKAVKQLIWDYYNIDMPIRTVGEYLKRWGFTPQKPLKRAYERNPEKVDKWLNDEYAQIREKSSREKAEIHWGDETHLQTHDNNGRSYAPRGETPVCTKAAKKIGINMISSITNRGKVRFMLYEDKMNAKKFITFIKRLMKDMDRKILFIVDNLRVHHAVIVKKWLEQPEIKEQIELFFLPPYSPISILMNT